jgi:hypothetical protein
MKVSGVACAGKAPSSGLRTFIGLGCCFLNQGKRLQLVINRQIFKEIILACGKGFRRTDAYELLTPSLA